MSYQTRAEFPNVDNRWDDEIRAEFPDVNYDDERLRSIDTTLNTGGADETNTTTINHGERLRAIDATFK